MIKALETRFNGRHFRSRREARWAVFFHAARIRYEYEPQGFLLPKVPDEDSINVSIFKKLPATIPYLPDFWLPEQEYYVEIKGKYPTDEENDKAIALAILSGYDTYIFYEELQNLEGCSNMAILCSKEGVWDDNYTWSECGNCRKLGISFSGDNRRLFCKCPDDLREFKSSTRISLRLFHAYARAMEERFGT